VSDRLLTLLGAGLALMLLAWLLGGGAQPPTPPSRPASQDRGPAGLLGLHQWLEESAVPVRRLRRRYTDLAAVAPATDNLLIVAEPMVWPVRPVEAEALRDWVEAGNHVLLLSSTAQRGPWAWMTGDTGLDEALGLERDLLLLRRDEAGDEARADPRLEQRREACADESLGRGAIAGAVRRLRPASGPPHPVLTGVREVHVKVPPPSGAVYRARRHADSRRHAPALLCDPQLRLPVLNVYRIGAGRVWAFDYSEVFSNDNLDQGDNAQLLANLVAFTLGPAGAVVFDDMHQGDSELYDPAAFFGDPRLHGTLAFLLGMWLLWLLGSSNRLAPPPAAPAQRVTTGDFMRAVGRFHARHLRPREAARGLLRHFFNDVRRRYRLPPNGEPAWEALDRAAGRAHTDLRQLRELQARLEQGRAVDLARLRNLILKVQDSLT
jgi:hypothetical protein